MNNRELFATIKNRLCLLTRIVSLQLYYEHHVNLLHTPIYPIPLDMELKGHLAILIRYLRSVYLDK